MDQKVPSVDVNDIQRIIRRDYSSFAPNVIEDILGEYKSEGDLGRCRIYAAILKLASGDIKRLKELVERANYDYRDIIAQSEYPNFSKSVLNLRLSPLEKEKLITEDWEQYWTWFNKV